MTGTLTAKKITTKDFDERFDNGEDVLDFVDLEHPIVQEALPRDDSQRQVNTTLPAWLVDFMDDEASRRGISRKAVINDWLVDRADQEMVRRLSVSRVG